MGAGGFDTNLKRVFTGMEVALVVVIGLMVVQLVGVLTLALEAFIASFATLNIIFVVKYRPVRPQTPSPNPMSVAIIVPVKDDPSVFNSIPFLKELRYPGELRVVIADDSTDPAFRERLDAAAGGLVSVLRRPVPAGKKAGAINHALEHLREWGPRFVAILDADHRPPKDFVSRAVTLIERKRVKCVVGYQKHTIGSDGPFGAFYRLSQAMGIITMKSRSLLGLAPIFGGSCSIFDYSWLDSVRFDETSITEDWELTLRGYVEAGLSIEVSEDLYADAAVPRNLPWFFRQQMRWYEGTISDFLKHAGSVLRSDELTLRQKVGLCYNGLMYFQALAVLISVFLVFEGNAFLPTWLGVFVSLYAGLSYLLLIARAGVLEHVGITGWSGAVFIGFVFTYVLSLVMSYAVVKAVLVRPDDWSVTRRRG
jgi:cellulose synthase/poly-beta-1,6-N-acetylglucosamine synthase-like glycosyltransferase